MFMYTSYHTIHIQFMEIRYNSHFKKCIILFYLIIYTTQVYFIKLIICQTSMADTYSNHSSLIKILLIPIATKVQLYCTNIVYFFIKFVYHSSFNCFQLPLNTYISFFFLTWSRKLWPLAICRDYGLWLVGLVRLLR